MSYVFGKRLRRQQIADIPETIELCPALSRHELCQTICEHPGWYTESGSTQVQTALGFPKQLEALDIVTLPALRAEPTRGPQKEPAWSIATEPQPAIEDDLTDLTPLTLQVVTEKTDIEDPIAGRAQQCAFPRLRRQRTSGPRFGPASSGSARRRARISIWSSRTMRSSACSIVSRNPNTPIISF